LVAGHFGLHTRRFTFPCVTLLRRFSRREEEEEKVWLLMPTVSTRPTSFVVGSYRYVVPSYAFRTHTLRYICCCSIHALQLIVTLPPRCVPRYIVYLLFYLTFTVALFGTFPTLRYCRCPLPVVVTRFHAFSRFLFTTTAIYVPSSPFPFRVHHYSPQFVIPRSVLLRCYVGLVRFYTFVTLRCCLKGRERKPRLVRCSAARGTYTLGLPTAAWLRSLQFG